MVEVAQKIDLEDSVTTSGGRRRKILIVDDEPSIRETLSQVLRDEGYQVYLAESGQDALQQVVEVSPGLIFLDMWMPGWDGLETLEKIRSVDKGVNVVMISGHASISNALDAQRKGALDFIEKPLDISSIINAASKALGASVTLESSSKHPGVLTRFAAGKEIAQQTIKKSIILYGQGLHSGQKSGLVLEPLPPDSGIQFSKLGGNNSEQAIPAHLEFVHSTAFATTLQNDNFAVATIEHLLSALHAYRITNLLVKCNDEVPIFDGSALQFCEAIEEVGITTQSGSWCEFKPDREFAFSFEAGRDEKFKITPADSFSIDYTLNYPEPVGQQHFSFKLDTPESFRKLIAPARTFGFMKDIERLQKAGLAAGGRLDNFILIGEDNIINTELRFNDELVRHKILDAIGDFFLIGRPVCCHIEAQMTGHSDNFKALRELWLEYLEKSSI